MGRWLRAVCGEAWDPGRLYLNEERILGGDRMQLETELI
jgi:hypothetical protein